MRFLVHLEIASEEITVSVNSIDLGNFVSTEAYMEYLYLQSGGSSINFNEEAMKALEPNPFDPRDFGLEAPIAEDFGDDFQIISEERTPDGVEISYRMIPIVQIEVHTDHHSLAAHLCETELEEFLIMSMGSSGQVVGIENIEVLGTFEA